MIYLACDHGGFRLKEAVLKWLKDKKEKVVDLGPKFLKQDDDFPDYAFPLAKKVAAGKNDLGILICPNGIGMSICANKVKGIRAGVCAFTGQAITARAHNNCNILVLPADFVDEERAIKILRTFLQTSYSVEPRYQKKLQKIEEFEK